MQFDTGHANPISPATEAIYVPDKRANLRSGIARENASADVRLPDLNEAAGAADASRAMLLTSCRKVELLASIFAFLGFS